MNRAAVRMVGLATLGASALVASGDGASADDLTWDYAARYGAISVRDRPRGEFQPDGVRIGNYLIFPEIGFRTSISNESFGAASETRTIRYEATTGLEVRSQLSRHQLDVKLEGRALADHDQEDLRYIDGKARIFGRIDIDHASSLFGEASARLTHSDDIDEEQPKGARRPVGVMTYRGDAGYRRDNGRIDATVGARYTRIEYDPVETNDGSVLDQSARNYSMLEPYVRLGMRFSPTYRVFGEVTGRHLENQGDTTIDRDARGARAVVGVELELSPLVKLMLKGGYVQQDYRQPGLVDVAGAVYEARLDWYVSPLVTLGFSTARDVHATSYGEASGRITTSYGMRADYEMWRNLIITAELGLKSSEYLGEVRTDKAWSGKIGADYMMSKSWLLSIAYEHQELQSSDPDFDRAFDKITIGAKYRF